ncbi:aspartyl-phosphate phosphatase Spo0E family protein [Siminovitchia fortis]|uniref:Aspartyl-phosphate phosphatase Spo0E family protein n=1 Tax=Siminovitchia fortis TaxID=254758 RepID=A0A443J0M6_9BACI|nr:aspartyl-phosphate phosphatase Spo0E family protein [Siminovitchia fortis]RWR13989.1 aspartyl-phosphate phosphatase Spo0E family protein [Siminovitchia fortis]WHY81163.1 aspartyl-phosphate phosphatase Spo0E family protein [Siminovitchia fortis]
MNREQEMLLRKIEERRKEMVELGLSRSFVDERVVYLSDQLDQLLNKYHLFEQKQASSSS